MSRSAALVCAEARVKASIFAVSLFMKPRQWTECARTLVRFGCRRHLLQELPSEQLIGEVRQPIPAEPGQLELSVRSSARCEPATGWPAAKCVRFHQAVAFPR
jgi:hypothetical protein